MPPAISHWWRSAHRTTAAVLVMAGALALACTQFTQNAPRRLPAGAIGHPFDHVLIIVLENAGYSQSLNTPYLKQLASRGRLLANFHGIAHPSYANYLAMITGRRIRTRGDRQEVVSVPSIAHELEARGLTWRQYAEAMPAPCFPRDTGLYYRKHVPFMSIARILRSPASCANVVPASAFDPRQLPNYAFYTPDIRNDGHNTGLAYASAWLRRFLDPLLAPGVLPPRTVVVVTFDESADLNFGPGGNHIYTVLLGDAVQPGPAVTDYYDHFDMLRTIEDDFGLAPLGPADSTAQRITGVWAP